MLKIFKDHEVLTSILEDFSYYDEREKFSRERKARQQACSTSDTPDSFTNSLVHEMYLKESSNQAVVASEVGASSRKDASETPTHDSLNQLSGSLSQGLGMDVGDKQVLASDSGGELHDEATVKSTSSCV